MDKKEKTGRGLSSEDARLWRQIVRSVTPLHSRDLPIEEFSALLKEKDGGASNKKPEKGLSVPSYRPPVDRPSASVRNPRLDDKTARKLKKGNITIDARIDLHGMTQIRAHDALFRFLKNARERQKRVVLVITGKGRTGDGILRRAVPLWLSEAPFSGFVSGWREAHMSHGGEGALYVRLRRDRYSVMP